MRFLEWIEQRPGYVIGIPLALYFGYKLWTSPTTQQWLLMRQYRKLLEEEYKARRQLYRNWLLTGLRIPSNLSIVE